METKRGIFDPEKEIWLEPNGKTILPRGTQLLILQPVCELTHRGPEKIISGSEQYYWKHSPAVAHKT